MENQELHLIQEALGMLTHKQRMIVLTKYYKAINNTLNALENRIAILEKESKHDGE